jgi:hypothetical protein
MLTVYPKNERDDLTADLHDPDTSKLLSALRQVAAESGI